jgi:hypothetical protein
MGVSRPDGAARAGSGTTRATERQVPLGYRAQPNSRRIVAFFHVIDDPFNAAVDDRRLHLERFVEVVRSTTRSDPISRVREDRVPDA